MRDEGDLQSTIQHHADTVKRICVVYLKNEADTEDIFQTVFLKYWNHAAVFESEEHKKAWLIRVAINECKNLLKSFFKKKVLPLEVLEETKGEPGFNENAHVREAVLHLPEKYKVPIFLHYFEGYSAVEIASLTGKKVNTVYTNLARGKAALKETLGGDEYEN